MKIIRLIPMIVLVVAWMSCTKENDTLTALDMLVEKKWYLEQKKILKLPDTVIHQNNYTGLPTFSFEIEKLNSDSSYRDSDGYKGSCQVVDSANITLLKIVPKNSGVAQPARNYTILHVGFDYLVIEYKVDDFFHRLYFSSRL